MKKPSIADLANEFIRGVSDDNHLFFVYGSTIVEPVTDPDLGTGRLRTITVPDLKWYLRRVYPYRPERTVSALAEDILHNPELPLPRIRGLVTTPTFRDDFSLITRPGFDSESGLYYSPDPSLKAFGFETNASKSKAKASLEALFELLADFPFIDEREKYTYISVLLTLFLRSAIRSVVPCLAIDGNGQSVGKGLLSSMLSLIAYGQDAATISAPKGRDEWASKLDSILLRGTPFQVIDNITGSFASDDLASILTSTRRNIRIKGLSKVVDVPVNTLWVLNGNDLSVDSDLSQRIIMCHLLHEEPEGRKQEEFYIQKTYGCSIEVLLRQKRGKYIQACLDVICGWVNAGAPRRKKLVLAKYGEWESVIGGIIDWIETEVRFLSEHQKQTLEVDDEREDTITFLRQLMLAFPNCATKAITVSQITTRVFSGFGDDESNLRDWVPSGLLVKNGTSFAKSLGKWLKRISTRRWGTIKLMAELDTHENVWRYQIVENAEKKTSLNDFEEEVEAAA